MENAFTDIKRQNFLKSSKYKTLKRIYSAKFMPTKVKQSSKLNLIETAAERNQRLKKKQMRYHGQKLANENEKHLRLIIQYISDK